MTDGAAPSRSWLRWVVLACAVGALGGGLWWWQARPTPPAVGGDASAVAGKGGPAPGAAGPGRGGGRGVVPAVIDQVRRSDVPVIVGAIGTASARATAAVRARVDGLLLGVAFREGQLVRAGDVIARLDPAPYRAALEQVQAQLAKDTAQLESARTDLVRYRKLLEQDSIASQQVDTQAALVKQLEATVAADRAQLATAQLNLGYTQVTAPIGGRTGLRQVDPGNMVRASDANGIVVITEVQPIAVVFSVPQEVLPSVLARMGAAGAKPLAVQAIDRDGRTELDRGELLAVDNQIDPATGTVKLKAIFPNRNNRLFPNQFVNVRLELETLEGALTIPQSAVQRGAPGTFVYLVTPEQTASVRRVQLGVTSGDRVVVASGLDAGDSIVIDGADKLRDGAAVTSTQAPPPARRSGPPGAGKAGNGSGATRGASTASTVAAPGAAPPGREPPATGGATGERSRGDGAAAGKRP